jgi:hypothetical protein
MPHDWDANWCFCIHCGCSAEAWIDTGRRCSPTNVIAISHILAERRLRRGFRRSRWLTELLERE